MPPCTESMVDGELHELPLYVIALAEPDFSESTRTQNDAEAQDRDWATLSDVSATLVGLLQAVPLNVMTSGGGNLGFATATQNEIDEHDTKPGAIAGPFCTVQPAASAFGAPRKIGTSAAAIPTHRPARKWRTTESRRVSMTNSLSRRYPPVAVNRVLQPPVHLLRPHIAHSLVAPVLPAPRRAS